MAEPQAARPARERAARLTGEQAAEHSAAPGFFDRDTAVSLVEELAGGGGGPHVARYEAEVSPYWRAARGPHGGYLAAMLLRALRESVRDPERSPRSLTVHYARSPQPGPVSISVTHEREGRSLSTLSARMEQDGRLMALALAAFSVPWSAPEEIDLRMPDVAPPGEHEQWAWIAQAVDRGLAPEFLRQLVVVPRIGEVPFSGSREPMQVGAWLGLRDEERAHDAIALALFSDSLYPPPFTRLREPMIAPTIDLTIHFRASPAPGASGPCFALFACTAVHEGLFESDGVIWAADGTLLAQSRQLAILMAA